MMMMMMMRMRMRMRMRMSLRMRMRMSLRMRMRMRMMMMMMMMMTTIVEEMLNHGHHVGHEKWSRFRLKASCLRASRRSNSELNS